MLSDITERKFIETLELDEYEIWTDTGWEEISQIHVTVPYDEYDVILENGKNITVADTHIFFDNHMNEIYAKDCMGRTLMTTDGPIVVKSVIANGKSSNMYDIGVNSEHHRYYTNDILSHNSITSVAWLLHYVIFNGEKKIGVLANKGATAREMLSRLTLMLENLPFFLQPGCKVLNKGSIRFSNNSEIIAAATSSSSVRGLSLNVIFMDEFAFVQNANEFYTSTYPVISSGKETKVIITSTPNGVGNMFYKLWEGSVQKSNEFKGFRIRWQDVPGRDDEWKRQTIANTSELQFDQEYSCNFIGSSQTLVSSESLLGLSALEPLKRQHGINYYYEPESDHDYIMTVDVSKGRGQDYSTFSIIDISTMPFRVVCTYRDNMVSPLIFPEYIMRAAKQYNDALVVIENNDAGIVVCNAIYYDYEYDNTFVQSSTKSNGIGVTMSKRVKRIGCSNLKDLLESGKLQICDAWTIQELSSFEPKGDSYSASGSAHDDMVMNLVMFAWFVSTDAFGGMSNVDLKELLYSDKIKEMEEDLPPFGIINDSNNTTSNFESFEKYQETIDDMKEWENL